MLEDRCKANVFFYLPNKEIEFFSLLNVQLEYDYDFIGRSRTTVFIPEEYCHGGARAHRVDISSEPGEVFEGYDYYVVWFDVECQDRLNGFEVLSKYFHNKLNKLERIGNDAKL